MKEKELQEILKKKQKQADENELDMKIADMYIAFENQHREKHGYCIEYIDSPVYNKKIQEREEWCLNQIDEAVIAKTLLMYPTG